MTQVISYIDKTEYRGILLENERYDAFEILDDNRTPIGLEVYDSNGKEVLDKNIIESIDEHIIRYSMAQVG